MAAEQIAINPGLEPEIELKPELEPIMAAEQIAVNPGFQHIGENIFMILNLQDLLTCRRVCASWNKILDEPKFWMKICCENKNFGFQIIEEEWKSLLSLSISANVLQPNIKLCLIKIYGSDNDR